MNLLKIELKKILPNTTFWILIGLYFFFLGLAILIANGIVSNMTFNGMKMENLPSLYEFPKIWHNLTFIASFFKIFLAIIVIVLVTNEFSYNTIRSNIINGLSREDFLASKIFVILILSLGTTIFLFLISLLLGLSHSPTIDLNLVFEKIEFIGAYFVQVFAFLIFAFFIGFWLRKSGFAIGLLLLYRFIAEPIMRLFLPDYIDNFLPMHSMNGLIKMPGISFLQMVGLNFQGSVPIQNLIVSISYSIIFTGLIYIILKKRDL